MSGQEAARRREAWQALRAERGSEDFFAYLEAVRAAEQFTRQPAEARRRVGELLETMWHNSVVRSAVFRQAAMPRGRAD
ncbi:NEL-type E3 ubiquitin ligase domain-containing protein, partial [Pantoea sp. SIMBA_072]